MVWKMYESWDFKLILKKDEFYVVLMFLMKVVLFLNNLEIFDHYAMIFNLNHNLLPDVTQKQKKRWQKKLT